MLYSGHYITAMSSGQSLEGEYNERIIISHVKGATLISQKCTFQLLSARYKQRTEDKVHPCRTFNLDFVKNANKAVKLHVYKLNGSQQLTLHIVLLWNLSLI